MQIGCRKCGKDVTGDVTLEYNKETMTHDWKSVHKCDVKATELRDKIAQEFKLINALEQGFIL